MSLSTSLSPILSPILSPMLSPMVSKIRPSPIKTPFTKNIKMSFNSSPFVEINEINNDDSPIFKMSPINLIKFAEIIDIASSYGATIENKIELPSFQQLSLSVSPPHIDVLPLPSLSNMKNTLYERRLKAKEQEKK